MLNDNDLSFMRESINELLPDTCYILSKTETVDASGGYTATWGTASNVACRTDFTNGVMQTAGGGLQPFSQLTISVPYDTEVTTDNRVEWNSGTYTISSVTNNSWLAFKQLVVHAA